MRDLIKREPSNISGISEQRQNRYDFQEESRFYVDVLTRGGDLCESHEDGTYVIVSDGSDMMMDDDEMDKDLDAEHEAQEPTGVSPQRGLDIQFNQTQGQQQSPKHH